MPLVQLLMRPGRKHAGMTQRFCERVAANVSEVAVKPADVLIAVHETPLENWGFPADPADG
jgi:phenylpyruvate tautomerase PptA (4-oxalocrotonate tautomerase family)